MSPLTCFLAASVLELSLAPIARIVVYETDDPFGGILGVYGFDVDSDQSVAIRFTPAQDYDLEAVQVWLWNNDPSGNPTEITLSIREDASLGAIIDSIPGDSRLETWTISIPYTGFAQPHLFECVSLRRSVLRTGRRYWIVAESDAPPGLNPVWAAGQPGVGFGAIRFPITGPWQSHEGAVGATVIWGRPRPATTMRTREPRSLSPLFPAAAEVAGRVGDGPQWADGYDTRAGEGPHRDAIASCGKAAHVRSADLSATGTSNENVRATVPTAQAMSAEDTPDEPARAGLWSVADI